jgi:hypothetical protein
VATSALAKVEKKKPPYTRYAFFNPYNLALIGGSAAAALATGHWFLAMAAGAAEAIWMLFAPDSRLLQRAWFDKVWQSELADERKKRQAEKFEQLPDTEKARALALRDQQKQIQKLAADNPSFSMDLLRNDLAKLEELVEDYLDLALASARYDEYLRAFNLEDLEQDIRANQKRVEKYPAGDERRTLAQKNLMVLLQRKDRYGELRKNYQTARGQMDLMENTFRLLADEIVSMQNPSELGLKLDELRDGVEAVRVTAKETERLLQAVERG